MLWLPLLPAHNPALYLKTLLERLVSSDVPVGRMMAVVWDLRKFQVTPQSIAKWLRDNGYTEDADAAELALAVITMKKSEV